MSGPWYALIFGCVLKSTLNRLSSGNTFGDGVVLVALREYYDGSVSRIGKRHMVLSCVAADDATWLSIESQWEAVRKQRGNPAYIHMTDLMALEGIYEGWGIDDRDYLLDGVLQVLYANRSPRIHSCTCAVDLAAHAR
jgi:hypothetical protein